MDLFRSFWQRGMEGRYVEELFSSSFADFPPYVGADQQRVGMIFTNGGHEAITEVSMDEHGDLDIAHTDIHCGRINFSTNGNSEGTISVKIPLLSATSPTSVEVDAPMEAGLLPTRITHNPKGLQLMSSAEVVSRGALARRHGEAAWGQVELDGLLFTPYSPLMQGRRRLALRAGPLAMRWTTDPAMPPRQVNESVESSAYDRTWMQSNLWEAQHTIELSCCMPCGTAPTASSPSLLHSDTSTNNTMEVKEDPVPMAATVSMLHPLSSEGDSLLAFAFQSDRVATHLRNLASLDPQCSPTRWARLMNAFPDASLRVLVVQTMASHSLSEGGSPRHSMARPGSSRMTSNMSGSTLMASSKSWYELPTLVSFSVSCMKELCRFSVAAMLHDKMVDVQSAAVVDFTPMLPSTPTVVKMGWDSHEGQLAMSISSLIQNAALITLGMQSSTGNAARFGIEVKL